MNKKIATLALSSALAALIPSCAPLAVQIVRQQVRNTVNNNEVLHMITANINKTAPAPQQLTPECSVLLYGADSLLDTGKLINIPAMQTDERDGGKLSIISYTRSASAPQNASLNFSYTKNGQRIGGVVKLHCVSHEGDQYMGMCVGRLTSTGGEIAIPKYPLRFVIINRGEENTTATNLSF